MPAPAAAVADGMPTSCRPNASNGLPIRPAGAPRSANRAICRQVAHKKAPFASLRAHAGRVPPQEVPARRHSQQPARGRNVESFRSKRPQQPLSARPRQSQVTTENHGVDSSILSLATSLFSCAGRISGCVSSTWNAALRPQIRLSTSVQVTQMPTSAVAAATPLARLGSQLERLVASDGLTLAGHLHEFPSPEPTRRASAPS